MSQDWRISENGPRPATVPDVYDACPPGLLPAGPISFLTDVQEEYLRGLARGLSEYLETPVSAALIAAEQMSCADFLADKQADACRLVLDLEGSQSQAFLGLSAGLVSRTLAVLLVIPPDAPLAPRDAVTDIEIHVMRRFFDILLGELRQAWEPCELRFTPRPMSEAAERPLEPTEDTLLVMKCAVKFGTEEGTLRVAVPALIVRLLALKREQEAAAKPAVTPHPGILDAVRFAALDMEAVLSGSSVRMSDLLAMEPGEILMLGQTVGAPVECRVNGRTKFRGELIQTGTRRAMQIDGLK